MGADVREIATTIRAAVADVCGVDAAELAPQTDVYDDLGADSLTIMELLCALEEDLEVELPDSNAFAAQLRTVGDIVGAFQARAS